MIHFFQDKTCKIYSPVNGRSIPLEQVPDPVFSAKMIGEGLGLVFDGDTVCAPCDGEILVLMPSKHAFGIKAKNGAEILVHIGLDTVNLNGEGFTALVAVGDQVKAHQSIIQIDRETMRQKGVSLTTPMVVSNGEQYTVEIIKSGDVTTEDLLMNVKKK